MGHDDHHHHEHHHEHHHHEHMSVATTGGLGAPLVAREHNPEWSSGLLSCDRPCGTCLYGFFFPQCAMASMRTEYDESNWCFNCLSLSPVIARNMIRAGYRIEGGVCGDIFVPMFCGPCFAAQILHEVRTRGPIKHPSQKSGEAWRHSLFDCDMKACLLGWCFPCCGIASARDNYDGSSFCLNCLCMPPSLGRNIIREGYGIEGNCMADILVSYFLMPCAISQMIQETKTRGRIGGAPASAHMH